MTLEHLVVKKIYQKNIIEIFDLPGNDLGAFATIGTYSIGTGVFVFVVPLADITLELKVFRKF